MNLLYIRILFILLCTGVGYQLGFLFREGEPAKVIGNLVGAGIGLVGAITVIVLEVCSRRVSVRGLSAAVFGLIFGVMMAYLIKFTFLWAPIDEAIKNALTAVLALVFCYLGMVIALRGRDEFSLVIPYVKFTRQDVKEEIIILDTSVIIDGRISDIAQTKFIEGKFVIPRFVLKELQQIADSPDVLKRNRGRRGLDILNKIRKSTDIDVRIHEEDLPDIEDVDAKLVKLAKLLNAKILTNDYNLNKVAELQDVTILNINELANTLKPVVLPGELMEIRLVKEGKEYNQGVAYLDDGTMVVVEGGKSMIGQSISVVVSSVLQTAAGRMIFAKLPSRGDE